MRHIRIEKWIGKVRDNYFDSSPVFTNSNHFLDQRGHIVNMFKKMTRIDAVHALIVYLGQYLKCVSNEVNSWPIANIESDKARLFGCSSGTNVQIDFLTCRIKLKNLRRFH